MAIFLSLIFIVMDSMRGTVYNFTIVKLCNKWKNVNSEMKCGAPTLELFKVKENTYQGKTRKSNFILIHIYTSILMAIFNL